MMINNNAYYLDKDRANELFTKPWGEVALILIDIKESRTWSKTHKSFTGFVKDLSKYVNIQQSVVWRILTAAKFYLKFSKYANDLPNLEDLSLKVPAENIELIEKISRYADSHTIKNLLQNAIDGLLTRNDLRLQWTVYKNSQIYPSDFKRVEGFDSDYEERIYRILNGKFGFEWLGGDVNSFAKVFYMPLIVFEFRENGGNYGYCPDLIIAFAKNRTFEASFNVVEIVSPRIHNIEPIIEKWKSVRSVAEHFWILSTEEHAVILLNLLEDSIGLLSCNEEEIKVVRDAKISNYFIESGNLAKKLIPKI